VRPVPRPRPPCATPAPPSQGALELCEQIRRSLDAPALAGLAALRGLRPRLDETADAVRGMLAAEFLSALADAGLPGVVAGAAAAELALAQERQRGEAPLGGLLAGLPPCGRGEGGSAGARQRVAFSHMRAVPPTRLLNAADAGNGAAGEDEPSSPFLRAGSASASALAPAAAEAAQTLQEKLLPLAVGLWRAERLGPALAQYRDNAAAEVKGAIRDLAGALAPPLLAVAGSDDGGGGGPQQAWAGAGADAQLAEQLQVGGRAAGRAAGRPGGRPPLFP
jgi:hypothetical protein